MSNVLSEARRAEVFAMARDGVGVREIERRTRVSRETVLRYVGARRVRNAVRRWVNALSMLARDNAGGDVVWEPEWMSAADALYEIAAEQPGAAP